MRSLGATKIGEIDQVSRAATEFTPRGEWGRQCS